MARERSHEAGLRIILGRRKRNGRFGTARRGAPRQRSKCHGKAWSEERSGGAKISHALS
jgi:hypothetical protein